MKMGLTEPVPADLTKEKEQTLATEAKENEDSLTENPIGMECEKFVDLPEDKNLLSDHCDSDYMSSAVTDSSDSEDGKDTKDKKKFRCTFKDCDKQFTKFSRLEQHKRIHTREV